jgi:biopolymer transport protein ExbB/TolQ
MSLLNAFNEGGFFMYVILAFGLFSVTFIVERGLFLYGKVKPAPENFREKINDYIQKADLRGAAKYASQSPSSVAKITATGVQELLLGGGEEHVQARMDEQLSREIEVIDRRTGFLAMFGNVATLVGLLGTITGMIHSFGAVATASPMDRATLLSKGISEAMNCTAFGLIIAVPALVAYAVYQNKTDRMITEITNTTSEIYHDLVFLFESAKSTGKAFNSSRSSQPEIEA